MRKDVVSFGIDPETLAEIKHNIAEAKKRGTEIDFSKWMRDAARQKLKRKHKTPKAKDEPAGAKRFIKGPSANSNK